ncbi:MAG: TlpA disulfide reductase family protein, partial [Acidobacteriota bacterium]
LSAAGPLRVSARVAIPLVAALAFLLAPSARAEPAAAPPAAAEPWPATDLDGAPWGPRAFSGKVVLLDFWATWCLPCIAEFPNLRELDGRFSDDDFVLLGVTLDAVDRRGLRAFLRRHGVDWPQIHEGRGVDSALAERYAVEAVPSTVLIDREGRWVARDLRGRALELAVETLVADPR